MTMPKKRKKEEFHGYQSASELYCLINHCGWLSWCQLLGVEVVAWSAQISFSQLVVQKENTGIRDVYTSATIKQASHKNVC
jgi:hypothetical protein